MPRIKQIPEDFIVKEIFQKQKKGKEERGFYVWFTLKKKNWDIFRALKVLSRKLGVSIKRFGYAGVKDKRAITYQRVSVWNVPIERLKGLKIKDLELSDFERKKERINLGDLRANKFEIVIRDIDNKETEKLEKNIERVKGEGFINYFGEQRFGIRKNTHLVGKEILRNRLKEAVWIYLMKEGDEKEEAMKFRENLRKTGDLKRGLKECPRNLRNEIVLMNHLIEKPNDYAGALRKIPKKFRRMFVHAYQSYLWNEIAKISKEKRIPIIGFRTDLTKYKSRKQIEKILEGEGVKTGDFKLKSMPELSGEGGERERLIKAKNLKCIFRKDELNKNKIKCVAEFEITKGSYATVLIEEVLK